MKSFLKGWTCVCVWQAVSAQMSFGFFAEQEEALRCVQKGREGERMRGSKPEREQSNKETMVEENMLRKETGRESWTWTKKKKSKTVLTRSNLCLLSLWSVELTAEYSSIWCVNVKWHMCLTEFAFGTCVHPPFFSLSSSLCLSCSPSSTSTHFPSDSLYCIIETTIFFFLAPVLGCAQKYGSFFWKRKKLVLDFILCKGCQSISILLNNMQKWIPKG